MKKLVEKIVALYKENQTQIICGALMLNGSTNVHITYAALTEQAGIRKMLLLVTKTKTASDLLQNRLAVFC